MDDAPVKTQAGGEPKPQTPAPTREPRHPIATLRDSIDRLFDDFASGFPFGRGRAPIDPWRSLQSSLGMMAPAVDVSEREKDYRISVELPGIDPKDVELSVSDGTLTVKGEKKQERDEKGEDYHMSERSYGSFRRSFPLPRGADPEQIQANFKNGVLEITVGKGQEAMQQARKIAINAA